MRRASYREAVRSAMRKAMLEDSRVFLMGEDVGHYGGAFAVSKGLIDELGPERIRDTPLAENAFVGAGIGAALGGMRPIVEIMTVNFSLLAMDQIVNNAATLRHMSGGQLSVPVLIRMATGGGKQVADQHSHSFENWYASVPGLKVLAAGTVQDDPLRPAGDPDDPDSAPIVRLRIEASRFDPGLLNRAAEHPGAEERRPAPSPAAGRGAPEPSAEELPAQHRSRPRGRSPRSRSPPPSMRRPSP